jgi:hypothetical protein
MELLGSGGRVLRTELWRALAALREPQLWLALALLAALLLVAQQAPLDYRVDVGLEEGYASDLPMLTGFFPFELANNKTLTLRWTSEKSTIRLPGLGPRPLQLTLRLLPVNDEVAQNGPQALSISADGQALGALELRPRTGASYRILVPPAPPGSSDHTIVLSSSTYTPSGDQRALGTPVDDLRISTAAGPYAPPWLTDATWLGAAVLAWLAIRRAGLRASRAFQLVLPIIGLACIAALLDPPRFAFGSATALIIGALGLVFVLLLTVAPAGLLLAGAGAAGLALVARFIPLGDAGALIAAILAAAALALVLAGWLRPRLGALYTRLAPPVPGFARTGLLLIALAVFTTHYGGKIYPFAMWGDIGFHVNRYFDVLNGNVLLLSRNRGVDFPYPPAFYLLLAPFSLTGLDRRVLLQLGGALLDAASPVLVYAIATSSGERRTAQQARRGLLAAGIYSFSAATLMTTFWNFSTHIFAQWAHLLLIAALVLLWRALAGTKSEPAAPNAKVAWPLALAALFFLQSIVYLGHFGFWMNMSLLSGIGLLALLVAAIRRRVAWSVGWRLLGVFMAAQLVAVLLFYSAYTGLFLEQARATASGGLTGLAGRGAVDRTLLWNTLWDAGFRVHFGLFAIPLALISLALPWPRGANTPARRAIALLAGGTFVIALFFAVLPFVSGSTLSTRWLMSSAWAIAVGASASATLLWHSGRAGRWLVLAMGSYLVWVSAALWLGALAWRIRPPEPF